jgi:hypothetical protein
MTYTFTFLLELLEVLIIPLRERRAVCWELFLLATADTIGSVGPLLADGLASGLWNSR